PPESGPQADGRPMLALAGIRVLDLGGPSCMLGSKLMADLGADVITIEPPSGSALRRRAPFARIESGDISLPFFALNLNKRAITLDLGQTKGQILFKYLAARADVVFESEPIGLLEDRGIGYSRLAEDHPELVWISVTPYGQTGRHAQF